MDIKTKRLVIGALIGAVLGLAYCFGFSWIRPGNLIFAQYFVPATVVVTILAAAVGAFVGHRSGRPSGG